MSAIILTPIRHKLRLQRPQLQILGGERESSWAPVVYVYAGTQTVSIKSWYLLVNRFKMQSVLWNGVLSRFCLCRALFVGYLSISSPQVVVLFCNLRRRDTGVQFRWRRKTIIAKMLGDTICVEIQKKPHSDISSLTGILNRFRGRSVKWFTVFVATLYIHACFGP